MHLAVSTMPESAAPAWAEGLNPEQWAAAAHDGGPLVIQAGAGTGKTATLVARVARLLAEGIPPERVLLVTFSRRAAHELVRRVGAMVDPRQARALHAGTFHAVAHSHLRRHAAALGLGAGFSLLDETDAADLFRLVRADADVEVAAGGRRVRGARADTARTIYSRVVNTQVPLAQVVARWFPWCSHDLDGLAATFRAYRERKRSSGLLDYDDLLLYWRAALQDAVVGPVIAGSYDHVLVDEYQDTNLIQADILRLLRIGDERLTVVGDDAQAIYSFRAATVRNLLDFAKEWPGATTVCLERNYRSTQPILDLANAVAAELREGSAKRLRAAGPGGVRPVLATCPDEAAQADAVCDTILEHHGAGVGLKAQAVLFRTGHHADLLELELRRRHIPFVKYGGLRFLDAAHVRDLVALLRILENPRDELAWSRTVRMAEGVGPATAATMLAALGVHPPRPDAGGDPLDRLLAGDVPLPRRAREELTSIAEALGRSRAAAATPAVELDILRRTLEPIVRRRYPNPEVRLGDLGRLAQLAAGSPSRAALLADLTLDPPSSTGDHAGPPLLDEDYVVLSTVHSAKGGEWDVVHVLHAADGMFPSDMATGDAEGIDEERRLFYVALTRARRHLHIYAPLRYHYGPSGDRHGYATRTRFLPPSMDHLLDLQAVRAPVVDTGGVPLGGVTVEGVERVLDGLW